MKQVDNLSLDADGSCLINGHKLSVPHVELEHVIATGASGVVLRGRHRFLERDVAVKFWLKLRPRDQRDKFQQGIAEARKADSVSQTRAVLRLFDAGESCGYFYAVMEYYQGITVTKRLEHHTPTLGIRRELAVALPDEIVVLARTGINHGDLHTSNILVGVPKDPSRYVDFKIIDFGTSLFSAQRKFSIRRHWKTVTETMDRILFPFSYRQFVKVPFPVSDGPFDIGRWYYSLIECGATWLKDPLADGEYPVDLDELRVVRSFLAERNIELTRQSLGESPEYWDYLRDDLKPAGDVYYRQQHPRF